MSAPTKAITKGVTTIFVIVVVFLSLAYIGAKVRNGNIKSIIKDTVKAECLK